MTRPSAIPFQIDRPVFVKVPFTSAGRSLKVGQQFKWKEKRVDLDKVMILYREDYIHHNDELEDELAASQKVGDGLDELNAEELSALVDSINAKVKAKTKTQKEFLRKSCSKSKILDKQRGHIRRWRSLYGEMEID